MTAKELAEVLLEHPDFNVYVGVQQYIPRSREYSYFHVGVIDDLIDIDEEHKEISLGKEDYEL